MAEPKNKMQLTFSSTVTENAYSGITMAGLILNQNSSKLGITLDSSSIRGVTPEDFTSSLGMTILPMYAGSTWSAGLSGSFLKFRTPQGNGVPPGTTSHFIINDEPYESGGVIKFPVNSPGTYNIPIGSTWRAYTLTDPNDDLHFGGATFSQLDLPFKKISIPQPQIVFQNFATSPYSVYANGATFTDTIWEDYTQSCNLSPKISLFWEESPFTSVVGASSREWLNYDPHYFLFFYKPTKKKRKDGTQRNPGGFVHPPSIQGPVSYGATGGLTSTGYLRGYPSSVAGKVGITGVGNIYTSGWRRTEWPVGPTPSKPLRLDDLTETAYNAFHPNQYAHRGSWLGYYPIFTEQLAPGSLDCANNRIEVTFLSPPLSNLIWEAAARSQVELKFYNFSVYVGSLTASSFDGTYLYFDPSGSCATVSGANNFKFTIYSTNQKGLLPSDLSTGGMLVPWGSKQKENSVSTITNSFQLRQQKHLYFRFAIGIFYESPSGVRKVIFGPMSETLRITPRVKFYGVEADGYTVHPWAFTWQARLV